MIVVPKGTMEVRWRRKGRRVWHHDRIPGKKNIYKGKPQKKDAHRTLRTKEDVEKRKNQLKSKHGDNIEFRIKHWGAGGRR